MENVNAVVQGAVIVATSGLTLLALSAMLEGSGFIRPKKARAMEKLSIWLVVMPILVLVWILVLNVEY